MLPSFDGLTETLVPAATFVNASVLAYGANAPFTVVPVTSPPSVVPLIVPVPSFPAHVAGFVMLLPFVCA